MATHSSILAWEIPMDKGAWWATVLGVAKNQPRLGDQTATVTSVVWYKVENGSLAQVETLIR